MSGEVLTVGPLPLLTPAGCAGLAGSTRDLDAEAVAGIPDSASETESQKGGGVGNQSQPYSPSSFGGEGRRQEQVATDIPEEQGGQASSSRARGDILPPTGG